MAIYLGNGCPLGLQRKQQNINKLFSKYKYLIVNLFFPTSILGVGISF